MAGAASSIPIEEFIVSVDIVSVDIVSLDIVSLTVDPLLALGGWEFAVVFVVVLPHAARTLTASVNAPKVMRDRMVKFSCD